MHISQFLYLIIKIIQSLKVHSQGLLCLQIELDNWNLHGLLSKSKNFKTLGQGFHENGLSYI